MNKRLKIAQISAEIDPFSKSGLGGVVGSLARTEKKLGQSVIAITPYYKTAEEQNGSPLEIVEEGFDIEVELGVFEKVTFLKGFIRDSRVPIYFIRHDELLDGTVDDRGKIYGLKRENARFVLFDLAALALLKKLRYKPDVIHCHDWHTGLIPYFLKTHYKKDEFFAKTACLFTIHNLVYQLGHDWWLIPEGSRDDGRSPLPLFSDKDAVERINFVKRALINSDAINTVSETYREEIMTRDFGEDLHRILKNHEDVVFGIVNGIDFQEYNPLTDPGISKNYNAKTIVHKKDNKLWLQKQYGLAVDPHAPVVCMTSRIVEQKGFTIFLPVLENLISQGIQIVVMGDGDEEILKSLKEAERNFPGRFAVMPFDSTRETALYAGADMFLLPSRFEPCGVNQLIAMRYGCIPIVHHIGGLADTVVDFDPITGAGNGFTFASYDEKSLLVAVTRAVETYKHTTVWKKLVKTALREANSWNIPAKKYVDLYKVTRRLKHR